MGEVYIDDSEEIEFIQKHLKECKIKVENEVVKLFIGLHYKYMNSIGKAPANPGFDKVLEDLKK